MQWCVGETHRYNRTLWFCCPHSTLFWQGYNSVSLRGTLGAVGKLTEAQAAPRGHSGEPTSLSSEIFALVIEPESDVLQELTPWIKAQTLVKASAAEVAGATCPVGLYTHLSLLSVLSVGAPSFCIFLSFFSSELLPFLLCSLGMFSICMYEVHFLECQATCHKVHFITCLQWFCLHSPATVAPLRFNTLHDASLQAGNMRYSASASITFCLFMCTVSSSKRVEYFN